jgi:hypothetical protein
MKKLILIAAIGLSLTSCIKKQCNCGTITNDQITYDSNGNACYSLTVRNSCSGNSKTWCFNQSDWMDANIGENFCVTNVDSW